MFRLLGDLVRCSTPMVLKPDLEESGTAKFFLWTR